MCLCEDGKGEYEDLYSHDSQVIARFLAGTPR